MGNYVSTFQTKFCPEQKVAEVQGHVQLGFEPVKKLFEENVKNGKEENAQLCVYYQGKKVVDLWCSYDEKFNADSLVGIFSSSKSITAIVVAWLVYNKFLRYDQKISEIWAEFTGRGKEEATIAHLMRHELGMPGFSESIDPDQLLPENIKKNTIGQIIEREVPQHEPGARREYHYFSRGWIINEVVRRADPRGRTVGQILREEICEPLGADVYIGCKDVSEERFADLKIRRVYDVIMEAVNSKNEGDLAITSFFRMIFGVVVAGVTSGGPSPPPPFKNIPIYRIDKLVELLNERRDIEIPSAGSSSSARGLAKLGAVMAGKGTFEKRKILDESTWEKMHQEPTEYLLFNNLNTWFTQGGVNVLSSKFDDGQEMDAKATQIKELFKSLNGFVGWMGLGGSVFQWQPELQIGFGYVPTLIDWSDFANFKGLKLQQKTVECVKKLQRGSVLWMNQNEDLSESFNNDLVL